MENTELEKLYISRPIEDECYTFEEWNKINALRDKSNTERVTSTEPVALYRDIVAIGDPVSFVVEGNANNVGGYVVNIRNKKDKWNKTVDISSALGKFNNMSLNKVWYRHIEDMSDVVIPETLKAISTQRIINVYKSVLRTDAFGYINGIDYPQHVMKAELGTREHIFSKEDKKLMKKN